MKRTKLNLGDILKAARQVLQQIAHNPTLLDHSGPIVLVPDWYQQAEILSRFMAEFVQEPVSPIPFDKEVWRWSLLVNEKMLRDQLSMLKKIKSTALLLTRMHSCSVMRDGSLVWPEMISKRIRKSLCDYSRCREWFNSEELNYVVPMLLTAMITPTLVYYGMISTSLACCYYRVIMDLIAFGFTRYAVSQRFISLFDETLPELPMDRTFSCWEGLQFHARLAI